MYCVTQPPSYNVPCGDPDKITMRETTMSASFKNRFSENQRQRYNMEDVSRLLNQTNFKLKDGHNRYNDYSSTATASYHPTAVPSKYEGWSKWAASWQNQQNDCAPSEDSDQPGHPPSLIRVFAVRMKKSWVLSYPLSAQRRLWSNWWRLGLVWVFAGRICHFVGFVMRRLI